MEKIDPTVCLKKQKQKKPKKISEKLSWIQKSKKT